MDSTDGTASPIGVEVHNNNQTSPDLTSVKPTSIFLENNIPTEPTESSDQDAKRTFKPKTLAETIETLKQNAPPLSTSVNNSKSECELPDKPNGVTSESPTENTENLACSLISSDIICNSDGTVYLSPSDLSSRLLLPDGVLNELNDGHCSPFPLLAKTVRCYVEEGLNNKHVLSYSVVSSNVFPTDPSSTRLVACLPCRYKFEIVDQLVLHANTIHGLTFPPNSSSSSAIIQQMHGQAPCLSFLQFDDKVPLETVLGKATEISTSHPSVSTPPSISSSKKNLMLHKSGSSVGCDEHPEGGIECPKCDLVLGSTRSLGGHMTMMHSRNSCKTLKCPKCNWHYKYQETLEIHMKEKHPDTEQTCVYCVTKQSHPRLARGENYMCGYKPYRCDVCNYSTTTKGNLSIHMQSDKHINNIQELQSSCASSPKDRTISSAKESPVGLPPPSAMHSSTTASTSAMSMTSPVVGRTQKSAKNTFRCDVCNYETNIARNLRIHMTSEKHTQNMVILQQNVKSMQRNMHMTLSGTGQSASQPDAATIQQLGGTMYPFDPLGIVGQIEAFSQQQGDLEMSSHTEDAASAGAGRSRDIYGCVICNAFTTDDLMELNDHITADRSSTNNAEHVTITAENHYLCNLCEYKTPLKANFQLHCKTDKHVQRVQLINHIREGGTENECRLKYLNMPNPVHIVCNVCSYQSNSIHKMQVHSMPVSHVIGCSLFIHLRRSGEMMRRYQYSCGVCTEITSNKIAMVHHVRKSHASQMEQLCAEGWTKFTVLPVTPNLSVATQISEQSNDINVELSSPQDEKMSFSCPICAFVSDKEVLLQSHVCSSRVEKVACPLCSEEFTDMTSLKGHLFSNHNVKEEAAQKLLVLLDTSGWASSNETEAYRCQVCTKTFTDTDQLFQHQRALGHLETKLTNRGLGFLCWKKGCNQYFKSDADLQTHFREIHAKSTDQLPTHMVEPGLEKSKDIHENNNSLKCSICEHEFRSSSALQRHLEVTHSDPPVHNKKKKYGSLGLSDSANDLMKAGDSSASSQKASQDKTIEGESWHVSGASLPVANNDMNRCQVKPYKCNVCNVSYTTSGQLDQHLTSGEHVAASNKMTHKNQEKEKTSAITSTLHNVPPAHGDKLVKTEQLSPDDKLYKLHDDISSCEVAEGEFMTPMKIDSEKDTSGDTLSLDGQPGRVAVRDNDQMCTCQLCGSKFSSHDALHLHRKLHCTTLHTRTNRSSRTNFKKLLKGFGVECVMGFLESEQQNTQPTGATKDNNSDSDSNLSATHPADNIEVEVKTSPAMLKTLMPPEMSGGKLTCSDCQQTFSSIWVLKAHKEEQHGQLLPEIITSHFGELYKKELDGKLEQLNSSTSETETKNLRSNVPGVTLSPPSKQPSTPPVKSEPLNMGAVSTSSSAQAMTGNAMDLLSYSAMNSWLSMFPFGMLPPTGMYNSLVPQQPVNNMAAKPQPSNSLSSPPLMTSPPMDSGPVANRQHSSVSSSTTQVAGEKRARTRISDDQLKILRQYFDINNSPSEESILEMASKTGLPAKVIKHWFRNTLFKERQRNKDSPYNFNNPPQTTLNLEEYEKTGRVPEKSTSSKSSSMERPRGDLSSVSTATSLKDDVFSPVTTTPVPSADKLSQELISSSSRKNLFETALQSSTKSEKEPVPSTPGSKQDDKSLDGEAIYPTSSYDLDSDHDDLEMMSPSSPHTSVSSDNANGQNVFSKMFGASPYKFHEYSNSSTTSKRANRTRFTDFQIKTLQDYFEKNAYPKDEELEQLSRVLQLPNRVIVVWFQNARQKARKVYENSPSTGAEAATVSQPTKSNYPCKKCGVIFTGYYELVKHQKRVCMKNNVVPLPFGNQETQAEKQAARDQLRPLSHSSTDLPVEPITDITAKQANTNHGLQSPMSSSAPFTSSTDSVAAPNVPDMAALMGSYGNHSSINPLLMPFMPLPGVLGSTQPPLSLSHAMKDLYDQSFKKYLEQNQTTTSAPSQPIKNEVVTAPRYSKPSSDESKPTVKDASADTDEPGSAALPKVILSVDDKCRLQRFSAASSVGEEDVSLCGSEELAEDTESTHDDGRLRTISGSQSNGPRSSHNKRYRTNLTNMQIHVMKHVFRDYKTPTMAECEVLGSFIGLQKRVVQVWFQNARAKEKKNKLMTMEDPLVTECVHCGVVYSPKYSIQEHIFSASHINQLRGAFNGKLTECDKEAMRKQAETQRPVGGMRRVSNSMSKKSDGLTAKPYPPTPPAGINLHAGSRANDYQNQFSRNLLPSLNPLSNMMALSAGADLFNPLMYSNLLQHVPSLLPGLSPNALTGFGGVTDKAAGLSPLYSLEFGTPLSLLQIPQAAINTISRKLSNLDCSVAEYSQDCSNLEEIYRSLAEEDTEMVKASHTDVGFACRKCQFVFPRREACVNHQFTSSCYADKKPSGDTILKIEQLQYTCGGCDKTCPTLQDFRQHCATELHKYKRSKLNNNNNRDAQPPAPKRLRIA